MKDALIEVFVTIQLQKYNTLTVSLNSNMTLIQSITSWVYSLSYICYSSLVPYLHIEYPQYTVYTLLIGGIFHYLDFVISDSPHKNLKVLNKNGYSNTSMIFYMTFNLFVYQSVWIFISRFILNDIDIEYYFNLSLLLKIAVTMILGDIYFYLFHRALHESEWLSSLHIMHHCCIYPSMSTGLMFDPIDLSIEFTGPNLILLLAYYIFNDPAFFVICGCLILGWYGSEHDENIQLHHYNHHVNCDGDYPVYKQWRIHNPNDKVKKLIKR